MDESDIARLSFGKSWRPYQDRVLQAMPLHLGDRKLHVVAAPGAGKTTLGLEAFRRFGKPALVLSPTRSIRDQWIARLKDFVPGDAAWPPPWISGDLDHPGLFTSITYQALHTKYRDSDTEEDSPDKDPPQEDPDRPPTDHEMKQLVRHLKEARIGTVILDEAHHLRAEWWKALTRIVKELPEVTLVSLTATPPYDVTGAEWDNYQELCGPIDEEISVPELVKAGTLCPHQDYVWMVRPPKQDSELLRQYDDSVERLCRDLRSDAVFRQIVRTHPWVASEQPDDRMILDTPEPAVAMLAYLRAVAEPLPRPLMALLDATPADLPAMRRRWWQVLVKSYLFDAHWPDTPERKSHRDQLAKRLRAESLLWRNELRLAESKPVRQRLSLSPVKIQACVDIQRHEAAFRGEDLRQVILTDFIRDDDADHPVAPSTHPLLGAWPLFRELARQAEPGAAGHMALLTGRLAVIHNDRVPDLTARLRPMEIGLQALPGLQGFSRVTADTGSLTEAFTNLLGAGRIRTLVATRSLLGEGWDAPVINSLVLCSFVGSFMLTNQMRGRAIRIDRNRPDKTSSIWHLVAVDPSTPAGLSDIEDLRRRFTTFVGLSEKDAVIENGLDRLSLDFMRDGEIVPRLVNADGNNDAMIRRLKAAGLTDAWRRAIDQGSEGRVAPTVSLDELPNVKPFHFLNTLRYLLYEAMYLFLAVLGDTLQGQHRDLRTFLWFLLIGSAIGFVVVLPRLIKALVLLVRNLPVDGAVRQIAIALRDTLCAAGLIEDDPRHLPVIAQMQKDGSCQVSLGGADFFVQSLFADCLGEVLGAIENPRYLITRRSLGRWIGALDYHAVPQVLGVTKERAVLFHLAWQKRVGPGELIYTRSPETRKILLKARARAFSAAFVPRARRMDRWQ